MPIKRDAPSVAGYHAPVSGVRSVSLAAMVETLVRRLPIEDASTIARLRSLASGRVRVDVRGGRLRRVQESRTVEQIQRDVRSISELVGEPLHVLGELAYDALACVEQVWCTTSDTGHATHRSRAEAFAHIYQPPEVRVLPVVWTPGCDSLALVREQIASRVWTATIVHDAVSSVTFVATRGRVTDGSLGDALARARGVDVLSIELTLSEALRCPMTDVGGLRAYRFVTLDRARPFADGARAIGADSSC
jgi:hypothetical protein